MPMSSVCTVDNDLATHDYVTVAVIPILFIFLQAIERCLAI